MPAQHRTSPANPDPGAWKTDHQIGEGEHAVIVADTISGYMQHDGKTVDLSPHVFFFPKEEHARAFAESVELEHARRGTHPLQKECRALDDPDEHPGGAPADVIKAHRAAHKALNEKAGI